MTAPHLTEAGDGLGDKGSSESLFGKRAVTVAGWAALSAILVFSFVLALSVGRYSVPFDHVLSILLAHIVPRAPVWSPTEKMVVETIRLPRALAAGIAGAGLALSGTVLQGLFRNPLVGPQTIGVASGAAAGGVAAILLAGFGIAVEFGAFAGAALALLAVLALYRAEGLSPILTLVLSGVVVGAFCSALVGIATLLADPETTLPSITFWLLGSFATINWARCALFAACTACAGALMLAMRWRVNVLSLGDEDALTLGINPTRDRTMLLVAVCLAVSAQVAVSGVVGWVGLIVPNLARLLIGSDHRRLMPASILLGAIFLLLCDTLARDLTAAEIPVGIVTAILGTPIFAVLLRMNAFARGN